MQAEQHGIGDALKGSFDLVSPGQGDEPLVVAELHGLPALRGVSASAARGAVIEQREWMILDHVHEGEGHPVQTQGMEDQAHGIASSPCLFLPHTLDRFDERGPELGRVLVERNRSGSRVQ